MNEDHQDESARVRHVPIHIESRYPSHTNSRSSTSTGNHNNTEMPSHSTRDYRSPGATWGEYTSVPNTSSVNINYKPPPPTRVQNPNNQHHQHQTDENPIEEQQSRSSRSNNTSSSSPDCKLVNSPEPIPLPPPQSEQTNNSCSASAFNTTRDQNLHSGNNSSHDQKSAKATHEQEHHQGLQNKPQKDTSLLGSINSIKLEVTNLLKEIAQFSGISAKSKDYRYLDEMLTRCMLNLDNIECGDFSELRQQRKAAIKLVDQATGILQRKLQINSDIHDLSESMSVASS